MCRQDPGARQPRINPPDVSNPSGPGHLHRCASAIEPSFSMLIERAVEAGGSHRSVVLAILVMTERHLRSAGLQFDPDEPDLLN